MNRMNRMNRKNRKNRKNRRIGSGPDMVANAGIAVYVTDDVYRIVYQCLLVLKKMGWVPVFYYKIEMNIKLYRTIKELAT